MNFDQPPTGYIIYSGPSLIDGNRIVAILTKGSGNPKTGDMDQVWILVDRGPSPIVAIRQGLDKAICGDCPHKAQEKGTLKGRSCYVNMIGPETVFKNYENGAYPIAEDLAALGADRMIRLGAYGDPAAVPVAVWEALVSRAKGWTGYTHQWSLGFALSHIVMASCDSHTEIQEATSLGYRVFFVTPKGTGRMPGFMRCPASQEMGKRLQCVECRSCSGVHAKGARSQVQIEVHGNPGNMRLVQLRAAA